MDVVWSPLALERVVEIAERIRWDKPGAAQNWVARLFAKAETIPASPRRGRIVPELDRPDIREIQFGDYRLIYRIGGNKLVTILTVRHGRRRQDFDELR
jgi:toxin ParE1/3/4